MRERRPTAHRRALPWLIAAGVAAAAVAGAAVPPPAVPPPSATLARVIVSGRTSTAVDVKVVHVGKSIPETFSDDRVKNTDGFSWWVSQHYALQTDYDEKKARFYLTLLELAYPHYVELFGKELADLDRKRMTVTYGSNRKQMLKAIATDLGYEWDFAGGGITLEGLIVAYQYPSGSLRYHKRYILIHECTHLYQMCLDRSGTCRTTPLWYYEGIADGLSSHVYDQKKKQLTVFVFDKAAIPNFLDSGLRQYRDPPRTLEELHDAGGQGRGSGVVTVQYFLTDPGRTQLFRIWRDEMLRMGKFGDECKQTSERLLTKLFGPWDRINADFAEWLAPRRNTFHYVDWGWEQDADTLWSYGWPQKGPLSRTDVNMPPREKTAYDPLVMDYPAEEKPAIVGPVARGIREPSVGCVVDFSRNPGKGMAGIGLGVIGGDLKLSFPEGSLFVDRAGSKSGINVTAYRLGEVDAEGQKPGDVKNGERIGSSVDAEVALGLEGSVTKGLKEDFVVEWEGFLRVARRGEYALATASDDGSWLWIDGKELVSNGGTHGVQTKMTKTRLSRGVHRLRIRYFQGRGGHSMSAGMTAGEMPGYVRVLVNRGRELVLDGTDAGLEKKTLRIPEELRAAMKDDGHRVGLNVKIALSSLDVTLRAGRPEAMKTFRASLPIGPGIGAEVRRRLLEKPLTILARDGYHGVTPFFDDARLPPPDLAVPAPPNRWRNPGDKKLFMVYKAAWRLGKKAPGTLLALRKEMVEAADRDPAAQRRAARAYDTRAAGLVRDIRRLPRDRDLADRDFGELSRVAVADLVGMSLSLGVADGERPGTLAMRASVVGPVVGESAGALRFVFEPAGVAVEPPEAQDLRLKDGGRAVFRQVALITDRASPFTLRAQADFDWRGERFSLQDSRVFLTSIQRWWVAGPFDNPGGHSADVKHPPEREGFDPEKQYTGKGGGPVGWRKVERSPEAGVATEHLVDFIGLFGQKENVAAYAFVWLDSAEAKDARLALGSDDGAIVWLNSERVHSILLPRGYSSKEDLVPIRLKAGRNALLVKITQGGGAWSFCAHLEDRGGGPLQGVTATLTGLE